MPEAREALDGARHRRARSSSPTTAPTTAAPSSPRRRRARRHRAAARLRQRLPRRLRRRARRLHRDGRRRPHLRLRRDPALRREARRRRRAGDGRPDGQHPAGRDAVAAPLRRQPGPDRHPQRLLPHRRERRPLRHARACAATCSRASTCARPGMEFASEMVIRASQGEARHPRVPDRVPPARRRVQALELPRRLAPPALPARPQPEQLFMVPGAIMALLGVADLAHRAVRRSTSSAASGTCTRWSPARC